MPHRPGRFPTPSDGLYYHAFRTTGRDRWLLAMLYEHQILSTEQITNLAFGALRSARHRLADLTGLGLIDRTRSNSAGPGASSYLYTLAPAGARLLAAQRDLDLKQLRYDRAKAQRQVLRPDLPHTLGCNTLMIHLATAHRAGVSGHLASWLGALSCLRRWGDQIRPDAYGHWTEPTDTVGGCGFFLEYDTGTESLHQLAAKIHGYDRFARSHTGHQPILIHTSTPSREARLHALLTETHGTCPVPIATTTAPHPHTPIWLPHAAADRTGIGQLPDVFTALGYRILPPLEPDPIHPSQAWDTAETEHESSTP